MMRKMSSNTISVYVNPFMCICSFIALNLLDMDFTDYVVDVFTNYYASLGIFLFMACGTFVSQILKFKAHQMDSPGKLGVWTYSEVVMQLFIDLALIGSYINIW